MNPCEGEFWTGDVPVEYAAETGIFLVLDGPLRACPLTCTRPFHWHLALSSQVRERLRTSLPTADEIQAREQAHREQVQGGELPGLSMPELHRLARPLDSGRELYLVFGTSAKVRPGMLRTRLAVLTDEEVQEIEDEMEWMYRSRVL